MSCVVCSAAAGHKLEKRRSNSNTPELTLHVRSLQEDGSNMVLADELPDLRRHYGTLETHLTNE